VIERDCVCIASQIVLITAAISEYIMQSGQIVTLRRARLVLRWVTVCAWVNHLGM